MSDKNKGNLILLLTAVLWGTGFISQKLGNRVMPPMTFNAVRQLMAAVVLTPIAMRGLRTSGYFSRKHNTQGQIDYRKKRLLKAGVLCGLFMLIGTATQQIGLLTVSAGKSGFISSIYIVFTPLFSVIVGSKVKRRTVFCIALAMFGFGVMSLKGGLGGATQGDWLTLVSAAGFAAQIVAVNCFVDKDNAILISQAQFFFCGAAGLVIALIAEDPTFAALLAGIPVLLYQTFVPTAGGYTLQIIGQKYTDSSTAALIMSLEAVFAMIFGAIFLREIMSVREIAGAAIIFAATIIGQRE
ncbi:MAG: DMT family transporter [Mogibacterium sp.]|nr:DMT family transporter [Mogibacterium sp.]